ncbi:MAG: DNA repair protein RecN [Actinobacteria bacterium]|nr:DNA repair protein RecN [Actinomycetota bacterium]
MIRELRIRALGVIDEAVVPFSPGLTVLSGETGAGKTMVLTGLGLLMGDKADAAMVRTGAERADIDGEWGLAAGETEEVRALLEDSGARVELEAGDTVLLLGRTVAAEGRSRAFAGGRSVPASTLTDLTDHLIAVHGQSDQLLLRDARRQRDLLDRFAGAGHAARLAAFREVFEEWRQARRQLDELTIHRHEREREATLLRHGIDEIAAVAPESGEDEALKAQATVLAHATDLVAEAGGAHDLIAGGDGTAEPDNVASLLSRARRSVGRAAALDTSLEPIVGRLDEAIQGVDELARELGDYVRSVEADPRMQSVVEERRQVLSGLKRKYGPGLDDVLEWWAAAERTVGEVDGTQARIDELTKACSDLGDRVVEHAAAISEGRRVAALRFEADVTSELHALAMSDAELGVVVETADDPEQFTGDGADAIVMLLRPHQGSDFRPLGRGASGGELSRIMLAIEVVLAGVNSVPTFVFDEVDAGIGGKVAVEVGRRLARLSRTAQVIVVTHLPQVAAFADHHVVVTKDGDGRVTSASVTVVEGADRVSELVRMLSGLEGSASGAEHASELLALAERDRA